MRERIKVLVLLHAMLMIYSMSGICSKKAASTDFLSLEFCVFYGIIILLLGFYAIGWQKIIRKLPLTTAFANKAVTVIWGMVWGTLVFKETITIGKIIGAFLIICGVVIFAYADGKEQRHE